MNNAIIRGCRIHVCIARYQKGIGRRREHHALSNICVKKKTTPQVTEKPQDVDNAKIFEGEVNSKLEEWVNQSLVYTAEEPRDLTALATVIIVHPYPTMEQMEVVLNDHEELDNWFIHSMERGGRAASTWLEVGEFPKNSRNLRNIDAKHLRDIKGDLILSLHYLGYRIIVKETGTAIQVIDSNNEVPALDDIDDQLDSGDDMAHNERKERGTPIADLNREVVVEPTTFQINSNGLENKH
ncbi:hypothetical protein Cgig2_025827 [Carnegiea gigantea]|uniref:Uncharacterized protein n=1 Tax=Carnegiea gigantea TaxID=171969 RepID=A0A9Q1JLU2_9CARY|nr:hypothetical protein Cgig2_025827 [Carnegiea gigantea]